VAGRIADGFAMDGVMVLGKWSVATGIMHQSISIRYSFVVILV
jgi:hypothetical protein